MPHTADALRDFTARYCLRWQQIYGHPPASEALYGIASPCITETRESEVLWQPQPFTLGSTLEMIERALDIRLQQDVAAFYTTQFAGDMSAKFGERALTLLQVWSEDDFERLQENLIGHLVMKRHLKQSPTLFIATTDSEQEIISLCNLTGEVVLERPGTKHREILADKIESFLNGLQPATP
ncbi:SecY-interacting protein [Candidatus Pantoea multigeneris]|uniref:Protein Syd n=1 Tax=Candidatus Pantoea multigeneris TaxID=2608357 RepID=A0ABX0RIL9_9GAMM|nr:SecY-interacting protein [Pantoea multigeneris]NIF23249.1 SecY-interacting protein [Pantoea multigeneris]